MTKGSFFQTRFTLTLMDITALAVVEYQYAQEILMEARNGKSVRSTEWVARFPAVIKDLNNDKTRLTGMKPADSINS